MTHQFKFGDIVRDAVPGLGVCVVINTSEHFVYITFAEAEAEIFGEKK